MRSRIFSALLCALLFAWPVAAQEQRGSIEGVVKDTSGAVVPSSAHAAVTITTSSKPSVSTTMGRFTPLSFLPPS